MSPIYYCGPALGADAGKPATRIAAVQIALDDFLDDRAEEAVLLLEAALIFCQESVKVVEQHPVEDSPFRMSRTVNSGHSRSFSSRNEPTCSTSALHPPFAWKMPREPPPFCSRE